MSKVVKEAKTQLQNIITNSITKAIASGALQEAECPKFNIEIPAD